MNYVNDVIGSLLFLLFFVIFVKRKSKGNFKEFGFSLSDYKSLLKSFIIGIVLVTIHIVVSRNFEGRGHYLNNYPITIKILIYGLLIPLSEEVFFRGWLQTLLTRRMTNSFQIYKINLKFSIVIIAFLFCLFHSLLYLADVSLSKTATVILFTFFLGIFSGYYRDKEKSLLPAIIMHISYNSAGILTPLFLF